MTQCHYDLTYTKYKARHCALRHFLAALLSGHRECGGVRADAESLQAERQPNPGTQVTQVTQAVNIFQLSSVKMRNISYFRHHFSEHFEHEEVRTNVNVLEDQGGYNCI